MADHHISHQEIQNARESRNAALLGFVIGLGWVLFVGAIAYMLVPKAH